MAAAAAPAEHAERSRERAADAPPRRRGRARASMKRRSLTSRHPADRGLARALAARNRRTGRSASGPSSRGDHVAAEPRGRVQHGPAELARARPKAGRGTRRPSRGGQQRRTSGSCTSTVLSGARSSTTEILWRTSSSSSTSRDGPERRLEAILKCGAPRRAAEVATDDDDRLACPAGSRRPRRPARRRTPTPRGARRPRPRAARQADTRRENRRSAADRVGRRWVPAVGQTTPSYSHSCGPGLLKCPRMPIIGAHGREATLVKDYKRLLVFCIFFFLALAGFLVVRVSTTWGANAPKRRSDFDELARAVGIALPRGRRLRGAGVPRGHEGGGRKRPRPAGRGGVLAQGRRALRVPP